MLHVSYRFKFLELKVKSSLRPDRSNGRCGGQGSRGKPPFARQGSCGASWLPFHFPHGEWHAPSIVKAPSDGDEIPKDKHDGDPVLVLEGVEEGTSSELLEGALERDRRRHDGEMRKEGKSQADERDVEDSASRRCGAPSSAFEQLSLWRFGGEAVL